MNISPFGNGLLLLTVIVLIFTIILPPPSFASPAKGVYHRVKRGETLVGISRAYHVPVQTIAAANRLKATDRVRKDRILFIPGAKRVIDNTTPLGMAKREKDRAKSGGKEKADREKAKISRKKEVAAGRKTVRREVYETKDGAEEKKRPSRSEDGDGGPVTSQRKTEPSSDGPKEIRGKKKPPLRNEDEAPRIKRPEKEDIKQRPQVANRRKDTGASPLGGKRFIWPVKGRVVSKFGLQPGGMFYNGVKIASRADRPVVAAASGVVIYSAALKDYGETVIVKHNGQFATVYTHLGERAVEPDNRVRQGSKLGTIGVDEEKSEGYITFEVRYKNRAVNPMRYLP